MKPLIIKELREHGKWAVLWFVGFSIALAFCLGGSRIWYLGARPATVASEEFQITVVFGTALAGLLLGLLQTLPELIRDQWSFLLHRPATRNQLFWGKVLAALILYSCASLIPIAGAVMWTAIPGNVAAPFHWRLALLPAVDVVMGFVYYFAALLVALRQARWYATRALPLASVVVASAATVGARDVWQSGLVIALAVLVLGSAARGAFLTAGEYRPQPRAARFSLGVILFLGLFVAGALAAAFIDELRPRPDHSWSQYFLDKSGRPLIARYAGRVTTVTDLQGRRVPEFADAEVASRYYHEGLGTLPLLPSWSFSVTYRNTACYYQEVHADSREIWYYVPSTARFEGFDLLTRRRIGWLGRNGFSTRMGETEPLRGLRRSTFYWQTTTLAPCEDALYRADWIARRLARIYEPPPGQAVLNACDITSKPNGYIGTAVALTSQVVLLGPSGTPRFTVRFARDARQTSLQIAAPTSDRFILWYGSPRMNRWGEGMLVEYSGTGHEVSRQPLPPLAQPTTSQPGSPEAVSIGLVPLAVYMGALVCGTIAPSVSPDASRWEQIGEFWRELQDTLQAQRMVVATAIMVFVLSIAVAIIVCDRITRRYAFSRAGRWTWRGLSVLLGLLAIPTLLSLHQWPSRVPCPRCSRPRRVDREMCEHCSQAFPPAEPRIGDIYDAESQQGSNAPSQPADLNAVHT